MHINEKTASASRLFKLVTELLTAFFWILVIYGFDSPWIAGITLTAAAIHECGHLAAGRIAGGAGRPRARTFGLAIRTVGIRSYRAELMLYLGGPAANVAVWLITLPFSALAGGYVGAVGTVNLLSGLSNLLPVEGYDGYGAIRTLLDACGAGAVGYRLLSCISLLFTVTMTFLSLYFIYRVGEGYWIFAVFLRASLQQCSKWLSEVKNENSEEFGRF